MEVYAAMADAMDHHVGRLVDHLKQTGDYDNTVFVFLSDNGPEASDPYVLLSGRLWLGWQYNKGIEQLGEKGAYSIIGPSWASAAASPLSTYKFYSGEGGIRVPLIIAGASGMPDNQVFSGFTHINDIAPTLLDLAQLPRPAGIYKGQPVEPMTGASLMSAMQGKAQIVHAPDQAIGYELSGNEAVFKGDYKLIKNIAPVGDGLWHLYDIRKDPGETQDLQRQLPEVFSTMQTDYAAYAKANGVLPMPEGYDPINQVQTNVLINVYVPRFKRAGLPVLAGLALLAAVFVIWRKRRRLRNAETGTPT
jgi:arylsulfatase A-like enzyme